MKRLHLLFQAGALIKAIGSVVEIILGILFLSLSSQTVNGIIFFIFGDELTEQPRDPIWIFLLHGWDGVSTSVQHFWAGIFIAHGLAVMFLVIGLLIKKLWVYPTAVTIFCVLVIYQIYHISYVPSLILSLLTAFDILFIGLIVQEYRYQKYNPS